MAFNSLAFLAFGAIFFVVWPLVRRHDMPRWLWITAMSVFFYGWWNWRYVPLMLVVAIINYYAGNLCYSHPNRKHWWITLGVVTSLGVLAAFKYAGFLAANLDGLAHWLGYDVHAQQSVPAVMHILPLGISFYTFQAMTYSIELYRGELKPAQNFWHYMAFHTLFAQMVAGPIERAVNLLPQVATWRKNSPQEIFLGLQLVVHGFFKKVVIADNLSQFVDSAFQAPVQSDNGAYWWLVMLAFTAQIYCDFSGYSDIARGLARWMGYQFVANFDHPYLARSMRDFWSRWHTSLSTWFRDYVYIPLGGNRHGMVWGLAAMCATMVLSGFWHGAAWTFVVWGALHAIYLAAERLTHWPQRLQKLPGGVALSVLLVLLQVVVAWVFFRATSAEQAGRILAAMARPFEPLPRLEDRNWMLILGIIVCREIYVGALKPLWRGRGTQLRLWLDPVVLAAMIVACIYLRGPGSQFIYFQF